MVNFEFYNRRVVDEYNVISSHKTDVSCNKRHTELITWKPTIRAFNSCTINFFNFTNYKKKYCRQQESSSLCKKIRDKYGIKMFCIKVTHYRTYFDVIIYKMFILFIIFIFKLFTFYYKNMNFYDGKLLGFVFKYKK